jgi:hypothetical protein
MSSYPRAESPVHNLWAGLSALDLLRVNGPGELPQARRQGSIDENRVRRPSHAVLHLRSEPGAAARRDAAPRKVSLDPLLCGTAHTQYEPVSATAGAAAEVSTAGTEAKGPDFSTAIC